MKLFRVEVARVGEEARTKMTFTVVVDTDLQLSLLELGAIVDLETKSTQYQTTLTQLYDAGNRSELVAKLAEIQTYFLKNFKRKAFEASVNLYIHITSLLDSETERLELLNQLVQNVDASLYESKTEITNELSIIALTNIFNVLNADEKIRLNILSAVVRNIKANNISDVITNIALNVETYLIELQSSVEESSSLLKSIFEILYTEDESRSVEFVKTIIQNNKIQLNNDFLSTFFISILNANKLYDLSSFAEIINSKVENASLVELLNAYLKGESIEIKQFEGVNVNVDSASNNLKLLSIFKYLSQNQANTIEYTQISKDLNLEESDVEFYLIQLIQQELIVAKLSQINNSILINQVSNKLPSLIDSKTNWKEINELLTNWNSNISNLQNIVTELISKRGKRVNAPQVIMSFHQQKLEAKKAAEEAAAEKQAQQTAAEVKVEDN